MNAGDRVAFFAGSAAEQRVVEGLVDFAIDRFGQLDVMVLNTGGVGTSKPIMAMPDDEWQYELNLNLNHTFWALRRALNHMVPRGSGRFIAMSSIEGKHGKPNVAGYTANTHAINGLVQAAAREVGTTGVTVNAICPGIVITDIIKEKAGQSLGLNVDELIEFFAKTAH
jgi:3-hydroxybutyrate dehydrogenase